MNNTGGVDVSVGLNTGWGDSKQGRIGEDTRVIALRCMFVVNPNQRSIADDDAAH